MKACAPATEEYKSANSSRLTYKALQFIARTVFHFISSHVFVSNRH